MNRNQTLEITKTRTKTAFANSPLPTRLRVALCAAFAATAIATTAPLAAPLPTTSAGAFDPTFNSGVPLFQPMFARGDFAMAVGARSDGKTLLAGYGEAGDDRMSIGYVARYNADGSVDTKFADGGSRKFGNAANGKPVFHLIAAGDGKTLLAGSSLTGASAPYTSVAWMTRVDADGAADKSFGNQGELQAACAPRARCYFQRIARQADGAIVAVTGAYDLPYANVTAFFDRFNADGSIDASFGNGGRAVFPQALAGLEPYHLMIDKQGRYMVSGVIGDDGVLARFNPDGKLDAIFGAGGIVRIRVLDLNTDMRGFDVQRDGRIVVATTTYDPKLSDIKYRAQVLRFTADGVIDNTFGTQGIAAIGGGYGNGARVQADGKIVYFGQGVNPATKGYVPGTARLLANGQPDPAFGTSGLVLTDPKGHQSTLTDLAIGDDDRLMFAGYSPQPDNQYRHSTLTRLIGTEVTTSVVEFYNATLNHYFVTANPDEASAIDAGAAGPGWSRTGSAWKSGGPARVCRFYGSPDVDASTQMRKGPNGHFYTISADECAIVKDDAGWKFESYDFSGWPLATDASCASGTIAVKRVYNNRFAVNDSNHRYTTSDAIYNQMLASGWSGEGAVFCAPQ